MNLRLKHIDLHLQLKLKTKTCNIMYILCRFAHKKSNKTFFSFFESSYDLQWIFKDTHDFLH